MKRATESGPRALISWAKMALRSLKARAPRAAIAPGDERQAGHDHRQREQLAHGQAAEQEAEMDVGLAEQLGDAAREAVADQERAHQAAVGAGLARSTGEPRHDREQHDPLEQGLVELARVARLGART